ncbi:MAG TPA: ABC transporter permease [Alphaproteobacteria bacterium]|jgi:ABC-2 type transport system permease protein
MATVVPRPRAAAPLAPSPRAIGLVNWIGVWTLYAKEVARFVKVSTQTIWAPVVTVLLFLAIFSLALGRGDAAVGGLPFDQFLAPGLVVMAMIQNAFANTSSSMMISKVQGNIVDVLMPPLSAGELTFGYAVAGATRGVVVGLVTGIVLWLFVRYPIHDFGLMLFHAVGASLMLALLGLMGGIWADKFDHIAAVTNFVITPLSFLSGTFYTIDRLPGSWQLAAHLNPFFYMIDGFRYGATGHADSDPVLGIVVVIVINVALWSVCHMMFKRGYKLRF